MQRASLPGRQSLNDSRSLRYLLARNFIAFNFIVNTGLKYCISEAYKQCCPTPN